MRERKGPMAIVKQNKNKMWLSSIGSIGVAETEREREREKDV
jgi:hypothetical protein